MYHTVLALIKICFVSQWLRIMEKKFDGVETHLHIACFNLYWGFFFALFFVFTDLKHQFRPNIVILVIHFLQSKLPKRSERKRLQKISYRSWPQIGIEALKSNSMFECLPQSRSSATRIGHNFLRFKVSSFGKVWRSEVEKHWNFLKWSFCIFLFYDFFC